MATYDFNAEDSAAYHIAGLIKNDADDNGFINTND